MLSCYYDPGMALYLSETPRDGDERADPLEWVALFAAVLLPLVSLAVMR